MSGHDGGSGDKENRHDLEGYWEKWVNGGR
jgi:hypothetical protein